MSEISHSGLARQLEISAKAVQRLVGSTRIELTKPGELDPVHYELGLRIERKYLTSEGSLLTFSDDEIIKSINQYSLSCPAVYRWLCSGDFNYDKLPETVSIAAVIHACRTAGRIRAELIRSQI